MTHGETEGFVDLTYYQKRVCALMIGEGMSYRQAGEVLGITDEGVRYHMRAVAKAFECKGVEDMRAKLLHLLAKAGETTASGSEGGRE